MAEIKNKTLWMRPVEWEIILKLLEIINRENGKLHPIELENIALQEGAFNSKKTGTPLAHSPRFYYRKALENLGLVNKIMGKYDISDNQSVFNLISNGTNLDNCKKRIIAELIVANKDCQEQFVSLFALGNCISLESLQQKSTYVIAKSYSSEHHSSKAKRSLKPIKLTSPLQEKTILVDTPDRIQGIFWGIRRWLLDINVIDEIITSPSIGRLIYVVNPSIDEDCLLQAFKRFLRKNFSSKNEWTTIYLPDFFEYIIFNDELRAETLAIRSFLIDFINKNKSSIVPIPISGTKLNAEIKFEKQDVAFKRSFLNFHDFGYVAHLHIHRTLI